MNKKIIRTFSSTLFLGALSLIFTLIIPSGAKSAFWMGLSKGRWIIFWANFILLVILAALFVILIKRFRSPFFLKVIEFLYNPSYYSVLRNVLLGMALFTSIAFLYLLVIIPQALAGFAGWLTYCCWVAYRLFIRLGKKPCSPLSNQNESISVFPKQFLKQEKWIILALILIGLIYFVIFIPINFKGAETPREFYNTGGDEYVMYPVVMKMLSSQENFRMMLYRFFNYGDYIYGFPFYGLSALLLVPSRLIFREGFADQTQINMLILRQLVSVLPLIISAFLFTYLGTRFKHWWSSIPVFLIILTLPGVIHYNSRFWHPDSLNLFFIALVIFFLDRDKLNFGKNFYFASIACGLSVATRLYGLFFFLAIAGLLVAGVIKKSITIKKAALNGLLFCLLMGGTILATSPYLFNTGEYSSLQKLSDKKQVDLFKGYSEADPEGVYKTGIKAWWPFLTHWFGNIITLGFLALSILVGLFGHLRQEYYWILLAWLLVLGIFLIDFILVKSFQYMLPLLVPIYGAAMAIPENLNDLSERMHVSRNLKIGAGALIYTAIALVASYQLWLNIQYILT